MKYLAGVRGTFALIGMLCAIYAAYLRGSLISLFGFAVCVLVLVLSLVEAD